MPAPRARRHTMTPNASGTASLPSGNSPPRRGPYPSPPSSERAAVAHPLDIKKKPRAMSEVEIAGSMTCEICGKGYKHASCLSKHRYPRPQLTLIVPAGNIPRIGRKRQNSSFQNISKYSSSRPRRSLYI